jgi:hypothetical protein
MRGINLFILAVLLVSACMEQAPTTPACSKPYILVGAGCCLDENSDGVCDKDKPVCVKPYILVGNDCCLDMDGNGACDKDQPTTTVTEVTTSTAKSVVSTTASTIPPASGEVTGSGCVTIYDCPPYYRLKCDEDNRVVNITYGPVSCSGGICRFRQTEDIGATHCYDWETCVGGVCVSKEQTTTTTISMTTTTALYPNIQRIIERIANREAEISAYMATTTTVPPIGCYDSDSGIKYNLRSGNVTGYFRYNDTYMQDVQEFCQNSQTLVEYYCETNEVVSFIHECPSSCVMGHCCGGVGNTCENDRDCCSGSCRLVGLTNHCV